MDNNRIETGAMTGVDELIEKTSSSRSWKNDKSLVR